MLVEKHLFAAEQVGAIYQLGIVLASSSVFHHIAEITGRLQQVDADLRSIIEERVSITSVLKKLGKEIKNF